MRFPRWGYPAASKLLSCNTPFDYCLVSLSELLLSAQENPTRLKAGKRVMGKCGTGFRHHNFPQLRPGCLLIKPSSAQLMSYPMVVSPSWILFQKDRSTAKSVISNRNFILYSWLPKCINRNLFIQWVNNNIYWAPSLELAVRYMPGIPREGWTDKGSARRQPLCWLGGGGKVKRKKKKWISKSDMCFEENKRGWCNKREFFRTDGQWWCLQVGVTCKQRLIHGHQALFRNNSIFRRETSKCKVPGAIFETERRSMWLKYGQGGQGREETVRKVSKGLVLKHLIDSRK